MARALLLLLALFTVPGSSLTGPAAPATTAPATPAQETPDSPVPSVGAGEAEPGAEAAWLLPETASPPSQWAAITMFHGLPSRNVRAIAQDGEGILWFGTDLGLVRYDGVRLERVLLKRAAGERPVRAVRALGVDVSGRLWIGTEAGAFVQAAAGVALVPETADEGIDAVFAAPDGRVFLASDRGVLFTCARRVDGTLAVEALGPSRAALLRQAGPAPLPLVALLAADRALFVGTRGRGLLTLRDSAVTELRDPARPFFVTCLARDSAGEVMVGAETNSAGRGLFQLDGGRLRPLDILSGPVSALVPDGEGGLWVGTRERGLFELRSGRPRAQHTLESSGGGLTSNRILSLFADRDGVLWVGTDRGVCRYDPRAPRQERLGATPDANFVHALLSAADGRSWAGTQRGLFERAAQAGEWAPVEAIGARAVYALSALPDGGLLAGTSHGLFARSPASSGAEEGWALTSRAAEPAAKGGAASVRAIQTLAGEVYVAVFGRGVERWLGESLEHVWPPAGAEATLGEVVSLSAVKDELWIGTARAGAFVLRGGQAAARPDLRPCGVLWAVAPDGSDALWLAAEHGLFRLAQGRIEPIVEGEEMRALLPAPGASGGVWCATARSGVIKVAREPHVGLLTTRLGTDYGLPSDSVFALASVAASDAPQLMFGTNRGLALFTPGSTPPGLRLVRVLGRRSYAAEEWPGLILDYPQNSLLVQAAAIGSRTYPEHFQYAFTLAGADGRPRRNALSRDGQFVAEGLAPGRYRIEARALGIDLVASAPVSLSFQVARAPVPWASIALGTLLMAALGALAWGYRQNRRLAHAHQALKETRLQLVQETETERRRIARDLHDQTLADLRRLLLMDAARERPQAAEFREAVETISTEVRRICEDLSPSVLENVGLAAALEWALEEAVRHLPQGTTCRGEFVCDERVAERLDLEGAVAIQVFRIVQEALANAVRHSGARVVRLRVAFGESGALEVEVEDDGHGFDPARVARGRGLTNIRSRAALISAEVEWRARDGGGCLFRLTRAEKPSAPARGAGA